MTEPNSPKERRLHPRYLVEANIDLGPAGVATLRDISMSGLSCLSSRPYDEMSVLEVTLNLPGDQPLKIGGAVVRCEAAEDGGHVVAIFFTHMDEANTQTLKRFIEGQQD